MIFSLSSTYDPDFLEMRSTMFSNEKYKDLSITTSENHITYNFHSLLLNDPELKTLAEFLEDVEEISLPKEIPSKFIPDILNYFYFREIKNIGLVEIFEFLKVVRFFHLDKLQDDILVFIKQIPKTKDKDLSVFLLLGMLKYQYILETQETFREIIEEIIGFFKENAFEQFLNIFKGGFVDTFGKKALEVSVEVISMMKRQNFENEKIFEFLAVFRENVKKLNLKIDFNVMLGDSFDLPKLSLQDLERFSQGLGVGDINELKLRLLNSHIQTNESKIENLSQENEFLKQKINKIHEESENLSTKYQTLNRFHKLLSEEKSILQQKFDDLLTQSNKDFNELKSKIKEIDLVNHPYQVPEASDKLNLVLFKHFKKNLAKKVLFDSNIDQIEELSIRIPGQKNLLFLFETNQNMSFGVFFSIEMPKPFSDDHFYKDGKAFMFDIEKVMVFKANPLEDKQLRTFKGYVYCVGDSKSGDGFEFKDLKTLMVGKRTDQFEGENLFGFEKREQKTLKRVIIFKINVEE